jgi:predicted AlkP superfamily phosphohydrolase/phosphomutase
MGDECRVRDPDGKDIQLFSEVHKPEELYGCARADRPWLPDLILTPHESLAVVRKIRGRSAVRWLSYRRIEGTHRPDGVVVAHGPGIRHTESLQANIVDCAPTMLAMMGLPVPDDMEGSVINDLFEVPPRVELEPARAIEGAGSLDEAYSEQELQQVTERLSDLGYLE